MSLAAPYYQEDVYYLAANKFLLLAALAVDRCDDTGFALDAHVAQIMAAVSAEAFIDEFAFVLSGLWRSNKAPDLARIGSILEQLEASRVQVTEKFSIASQLLPGTPFDPGSQPFQSFSQLIKLRNFLAHPKGSPSHRYGSRTLSVMALLFRNPMQTTSCPNGLRNCRIIDAHRGHAVQQLGLFWT